MTIGIEALELVRAVSIHVDRVAEVGTKHKDGLKPLFTSVSTLAHPRFNVFGDNVNNHLLTVLKRGKLAHRFHDIPTISLESVNDNSVKVRIHNYSSNSTSRLQLYEVDTCQANPELTPAVLESERIGESSINLPLNSDK